MNKAQKLTILVIVGLLLYAAAQISPILAGMGALALLLFVLKYGALESNEFDLEKVARGVEPDWSRAEKRCKLLQMDSEKNLSELHRVGNALQRGARCRWEQS